MNSESRLQKLLNLLESANDTEVLQSACHSIKDIAASHPQQLPFILQKVCLLLKSKVWDCRIAAGTTIGLMAQHFCHHTINDLENLCALQETDSHSPAAKKQKSDHSLSILLEDLVNFDVESVISTGTLLAATGPTTEPQEQEADLGLQPSLSARERNKIRRTRSVASDSGSSRTSSIQSDTEESIVDGRWPFQNVFSSLLEDLMDPTWEIRHGAAVGLRELLYWQAASAGIVVELEKNVPSGWSLSGKSTLRDIVPVKATCVQSNIKLNRLCLESCCVRILKLIVLDRIGDYLSDKMVAPVRETASQAFRCCLAALPNEAVHHFAGIFNQMVENKAWEVRHSGYILIKYMMVTKRSCFIDQSRKTRVQFRGIAVEGFLRCVLKGLRDKIDDVRAAAADVLVPIAESLPSILSPDEAAELRNMLWSNLGEVDDLCAATPSILHLLCKLYNHVAGGEDQLQHQLPSLFPFFTHPLAAVRSSAVHCFQQLLRCKPQIQSFLRRACCLLFFNLLTEAKDEIIQLNETTWRDLVMSFDVATLRSAVDDLVEAMLSLACTPGGATYDQSLLARLEIDKAEELGERLIVGSQFSSNVFRMRFGVCRSLAVLLHRLSSSQPIIHLTSTDSATCQLVACLISHFWAVEYTDLPGDCYEAVARLIGRDCCYSELMRYEWRLRNEFSAFQNEVCMVKGIVGAQYFGHDTVPISEIEHRVKLLLSEEDSRADSCLAVRQQQVIASAKEIADFRIGFKIQVAGCAAAVVVDSRQIPQKLNSIVQPLMAGIRREKDLIVRNLFAEQLAKLIVLCQKRRSASQRMVENICTMVCETETVAANSDLCSSIDTEGINHALGVLSPDASDTCPVSKRGAEAVLRFLVGSLKDKLFDVLPCLRKEMEEGIGQSTSKALRCIQIFQIIGPELNPVLFRYQSPLSNLLQSVCSLAVQSDPTLRLASSRCCARLTSSHTEAIFPLILDKILPSLAVDRGPIEKEGSLIVLHHILESLGSKIVPYIVFLIVPLLKLMSDFAEVVRKIAASCFGRLTSLLPLISSFDPPPNLIPSLTSVYHENLDFVKQFTYSKKSFSVDIPDGLAVSLRTYQIEGVCWMSFLRRSGLHGILADDMGLGKTIQALLAVLMARTERKKSGAAIPSIVVCPATLVPHWCNEVDILMPNSLTVLAYNGNTNCRMDKWGRVLDHDLVVMSYETLKSDVDLVDSIQWNYCILDEGHIIRNTESKVWRCCKRIQAKHRLILSGTPVQNSVMELWALFEFLIPGFLGTKKDFTREYGKAINSARYSKRGSPECTRGDLMLTSLHKRVNPFIMRRTKDEVLQDLPPKIIQDVYCDLSPVQRLLYEDFEKSDEDRPTEKKICSFESLQYLRQLCSHPLLVLNWTNENHRRAMTQIFGDQSMSEDTCRKTLSELIHSPKLQILRDLFCQCGIASCASPLREDSNGHHRMLIFAQMKSMLSMVEESLLQRLSISYLRLDGSIATKQRAEIVHQFNSDPTISVLLLTTKVGGLGLNLTSADIVVFLEHDWNPAQDLQAMDRAHRLGQKRTVNVYRILTRGTLEEKIMNLQEFKRGIANSVVTKDDRSSKTMDTSKILDLFHKDQTRREDRTEITDEEYADRYDKEFCMSRYDKNAARRD